jgi:hypothetical protein
VAATAATRNTQLRLNPFFRTGGDSFWEEKGGGGFGLVAIGFILPNLVRIDGTRRMPGLYTF